MQQVQSTNNLAEQAERLLAEGACCTDTIRSLVNGRPSEQRCDR